LDGMVDTEGPADGCAEIDGDNEGIAEGASLCGSASAIRKSVWQQQQQQQ